MEDGRKVENGKRGVRSAGQMGGTRRKRIVVQLGLLDLRGEGDATPSELGRIFAGYPG